MTDDLNILRLRMQERRWLVAASALVVFGLMLTFGAKTRGFDAVRGLLDDGAMVNLSEVESSRALAGVFADVYDDPADQALAAGHVYNYVVKHRAGRLVPWALPNVGHLNTDALAVPRAKAEAGGTVFRERLAAAPEAEAIPLVGGMSDLRVLKDRFVVRSPERYIWTFWLLTLGYLGLFWGVHGFWCRNAFAGDAVLLPLLHVLTGLGLMLMFSLPDPLRDLMRAGGYVGGLVGGLALMAYVSRLDFQNPVWRKHTYRWLGGAVAVAAVLFLFGSGPTGSAARVNLRLPLLGSIQPVEVIKLCLVLFLAGYFARHWDLLRELKERNLPRPLRRLNLPRYRDLLPVLGGVGVALLTFFALRDMGPALVVACTFLGLYGIVRNRWLAVGLGFAALAGVFWLTYRTGAVPMVADRIAMLLSPWENFVWGGEHLAHAYWALASGGAAGQGIGQGHPDYIPAAHTDMVLPAIGEEMGLVGLVVVFALYALLLYRAGYIALRARGMYSLFLGLSVALIVFFQVFLIAAGAFGLAPLSGVVTPFLSFGKSAMLAHGVMLGMLMSCSARPAEALQREAQRASFRKPLRLVTVAAFVLFGVIGVRAAYIQVLQADDWAIRPALVVRGSGTRAYVYNPRILDARHALTRGTIFDRNGIPLATSRWDDLAHRADRLAPLGVSLDSLRRTDERHYPFFPLTFYLLGDVQTRVKWGAENSLYAEHALLSHLRGYDNYPEPVEKKRTPEGVAEPVVRYDYSELISLVRHGPENRDARALIERNRDVYLTVDIRLQQAVARVLAERVPEGKTASAVVLDAATGDVLASVTYPLPAQARTDPAAAHADRTLFDRGYGQGAKPPGSTFKLVTALAALNADPAAARWTHVVHARDRYARRNEPTGTVNMGRGLASSSNVYFAALAHEVVGADSLVAMSEAFGFGIGAPGLSTAEQRALLREPDNLRQAGFGQGPLTASPLQVARIAAAIAAGGALPEVRWVRYPAPKRAPLRFITLPRHAELVAAYMRRAVTDERGTAKALRAFSVPMAGKTGTAEEKLTRLQDGQPTRVTLNHAWFTGFAPFGGSGPKIAIAVLVEEGGMGGVVATPIAGAIAEEAATLGLIERNEP